MLIRSQDKKALINLDNVTRLTADKIYGKDETGWLIEEDKKPFTECLGRYSTEAKAIKVLSMIQAEYLRCVETGENGVRTAVYNFPKVFQMPQDLEV